MTPPRTDASPDDRVVQEAIAWRVRLQSGTATPADMDACCTWRAARADHEQAWSRLESLSARVQTLPSRIAHATLGDASTLRRRQGRRDALKVIGVLGGAGLLALAASPPAPWRAYMADVSTGRGERRTVTLADGSRVDLHGRTSIDAHYDNARREVRLHRGEVLITTAKDPTARFRPFTLQTRQGAIRALGTRFRVQDQDGLTLVAVYEGAVEVTPVGALAPQRVDAGEQWIFGGDTTQSKTTADPDGAAWVDGVIVARHMPLGTLINELDRSYRGRLRCHPAVADLEISGVFPLDDPARVLAAVARTLPVSIDTLTSYWVTVRPAPP